MSISINKANKDDFPEIYDMIVEFASFQKTPEKVKISLEEMIDDEEEINALIIRSDHNAIGFATFYFGYSSWSGRHLYLDDIYIQEDFRNRGIGDQVLDILEEVAKSNLCKSMRWLVSKWNENAIRFYKKRGASIDHTEHTCQINL